MPRYQIAYNNYPTYLISRTFMLGHYYIQIDYPNDKTTISKLEACFLFDTVELLRALPVDFKNPQALLDKISTLMVFS